MEIYKILARAKDHRASDIHITPNKEISYRINGQLRKTEMFLSQDQLDQIIREVLDQEKLSRLKQDKTLDLSLEYKSLRARLHIYRQSTGYALAIRLLDLEVPTMYQLNLPRQFSRLKDLESGLVLISGRTGMGKTSSLAALIEDINQNRNRHIVTIEDPIEYRFVSKESIIHQREMGRDLKDLSQVAQSIVRQDPDIIVLGEMRDRQTIELGLELAELGHLVLSTLHTRSVVDTVTRLLDVFSGDEKAYIRTQLSYSLEYIINQELVKIGDKRYPICEILKLNSASKNIIRESGKLAGLQDQIEMDRENNLTKRNSYKNIIEKLG